MSETMTKNKRGEYVQAIPDICSDACVEAVAKAINSIPFPSKRSTSLKKARAASVDVIAKTVLRSIGHEIEGEE